jgi:hypothetical protein
LPLERAQGDYSNGAGAVGNQLQNDLEVIATHLPLLPEDHGSTTAAATALVSGEPPARAR